MGTTEGAGGLSTTAIEGCIALADFPVAGGGPTIATNARAELAALVEAAGQVGPLRAALTHAARVIHQQVSQHEGWDPHQWDGWHRQGYDAIWGPIDAALADAGPGAAGARDEAVALEAVARATRERGR